MSDKLNEKLKKLSLLKETDAEVYKLKEELSSLEKGDKEKLIFAKLLALEKANNEKLCKLNAEQKKIEDSQSILFIKKEKAHKAMYSGNITNPKELRDLQAEEDSLTHRIADMDVPLLEILEQIEVQTAREQEIADRLNDTKKNYQRISAEYKKNSERLAFEINNLNEESKQRRLMITDEVLLSRYDGIRKKGHGVGVSVIYNDSDRCSVCQTAISPNMLSKLNEANEICFCENCGRIIYLNSER